ncbi:MAG: hypothetical protein CVT92_04635 [Bacteroidetes bacterium HGW-Bacteroidetes-1]|jgi:hypothetical protein|nr:MAG: hypothetical protein CVT92_04635 [Bacteroidetes bacterium HGW-Bacteroidetes-1]
MISYLKNKEIDKVKWDKCIREAFNGNVYGWSWYLDVVHKNWEALVEDDYERVFPLTGNSRFGISYLFQPFFAQQLGIFSRNILNSEIVNQFLNTIPGHYRFAEIKLNTHNKIDETRFSVQQHLNHELDLIHTYDRLAKKYATNTRRNLKKAIDARLSLSKNIRPEDIIELFRQNRGRTINHWNKREYNRLAVLIYAAIYRGQAMLYGAYTPQNELCAGAVFVKSHEKIVFLFSGTNALGRESQALTFLIDAVIKEFSPGHFVFDFEGSDNPNLARYYKGFGSKETSYPGILINRLPFLLKIGMKILKRKK